MPNWVSTIVTFDGESADIQNVIAEIGSSSDDDDQRVFDFNNLFLCRKA